MTADKPARDENETTEPGVAPPGTKHRWLTWRGVVAVVLAAVLAGSLWHGFGRGGGVSMGEALTACATTFPGGASSPTASIQPAVVGIGNSAALIAFDASSGWRWCFTDGNGVGGGVIASDQLRAAVGAPVAVVDGGLNSDVLLLVHLAKQTTSVVVTTAQSRSVVLGQGGGFEVLRIPMAKWPHWHAPWSRVPVALGRIIGFDATGRVTSSQAFTWCPGSIDTFPARGC